MKQRCAGVAAILICILLAACRTGDGDRADRLARGSHDARSRAARPGDRPDEAQRYYLEKRLPPGDVDIPVERYLAARERMRHMQLAEKRSFGAWSSLGPGNIGGRTRALLIHPKNPRVLYAAGVAGGVWKTTDGGRRWFPLSDLMPNLAVNTLAMDPASPDTLYAGTGEGTFPNRAVRGAGIFRTADGGITWQRLPATAGEEFWYVNDVAVSKADPRRIYAATWKGVFRSLDRGASWVRVLDPGTQYGCLDLALRTDLSADMLFAACGTLEPSSAVWRNPRANAPRSRWQKVLTEPQMGRTTLALAPSNQNVIYALAASYSTRGDNGPDNLYFHSLHAVFRSTAGGAEGTWEARVRNSDSEMLNTLLLSYPSLRLCTDARHAKIEGQGWYDNTLAVDPVDPERVWAGGIDLFRSDDGGRRWGLASYWWANGSSSYVHADQHVLVFHPGYNGTTNRVLFAANDGGIFRTMNALATTARGQGAACDAGRSQMAWQALNNDYAVTQFYHGVPFPDGSAFLGGTQDNGTVLGRGAAGRNGWRVVLDGDGGYVAVDPRNPKVLYAERPTRALQKSVDGGVTFAPAQDGLGGFFSFVTPFLIDPQHPDRLWMAGYTVWRTEDSAAQWQQASEVWAEWQTDRGVASTMTIHPADSDRLLVGTTKGTIHHTAAATTSNEHTVWPGAKPRSGWVSGLAFDPQEPGVAYAVYSTFGGVHVWKTVDGGATWTPLDGSGAGALPDLPVHAIAVDPTRRRRLYIGTDLGIFVSVDGGKSWTVENTGFANVVTEALQTLQAGGKTWLYAFTHGRGAWRVPLTE
ncbi:MAG TPA: hypothetical protein VGX68_14655 [Thermoanaerobaculia bacterium]|jgi:photosystem II stability/assembly factor-like uncharacterized protein|nr:hypothetical protein [Thermoanaerobaculia bacterium]